jgi:hypothetical protein
MPADPNLLRTAQHEERLAVTMLPANVLDHPGVFDDLFANSEFEQDA